MQPSQSTVKIAYPRRVAGRPTALAIGLAVAAFIVVLAVIGASADHGAGAAQLRRGPASIVFSVLITITGLAGVGSLMLLFWGLVTRNRRRTDSSTRRRHSPILLAGGLLAMFACLTALLVVALHRRHFQPFSAPGAGAGVHLGQSASSLPFNQAASFTTSGIVVGIVLCLVLLRLARSMGWRRALRRFVTVPPERDRQGPQAGPEPTGVEPFGAYLAGVSVPDPMAEPDPRRAVIACYLQLLEVAARHGPERRMSETPAEYLRRVLTRTEGATVPATSLTGMFEKARYSAQPVDESMRSGAVRALAALKTVILTGAVS